MLEFLRERLYGPGNNCRDGQSNRTLTNDEGFNTNFAMMVSESLPVPNGTNVAWPGYNPIVNFFSSLARFKFR